ncbi:SRPBCC family protein [Streptomyces piniterrae]|uniref:SRPBCC family protein n=1 Tax=Streptomyces piniterrae TaxID=2571125 RepID=A0A4V5MI89_9ACTN|nr:SRPBCC family protein [Streptomyces piniterrae]TJZ44478.1 SRPBCC family protein [Streptomyces piniterrae]
MRIPRFPEPAATGTVTIRATPAEAYRIISDPPVMIRFAEEAHRARWLRDATAPAVGARFRGYNRNGLRRWTTTCRVTDATPGRRFAYEVTAPLGIPISRWQYDIEPSGEGCTVTETNWLRVPAWFIPFAILITGVFDRMGTNDTNIDTTLQRLKAHLEAAAAPSVA